VTSNDDDDDDDDDNYNEKSPTKKRKVGKPKETLKVSKSGPEAKEEDEGGESN
jgi:hypothetical protein